jgi:hypothetical protein
MLDFNTQKKRISPLNFLSLLRKKAGKQEPLLLLTTLFVAFVPSIAQASCLIWTSWEDTRLTQQQCLNRAEVAIRNAGFTSNFSPLESGVYAERGSYSGTIRCISSKKMAFFIVAGPSASTARRYLTLLEQNY